MTKIKIVLAFFVLCVTTGCSSKDQYNLDYSIKFGDEVVESGTVLVSPSDYNQATLLSLANKAFDERRGIDSASIQFNIEQAIRVADLKTEKRAIPVAVGFTVNSGPAQVQYLGGAGVCLKCEGLDDPVFKSPQDTAGEFVKQLEQKLDTLYEFNDGTREGRPIHTGP